MPKYTMLAVPIKSPMRSMGRLRQSGNQAAPIWGLVFIAGVNASQSTSTIATGSAQIASAPCQPRGLSRNGSVIVAAITSPTKMPFV